MDQTLFGAGTDWKPQEGTAATNEATNTGMVVTELLTLKTTPIATAAGEWVQNTVS